MKDDQYKLERSELKSMTFEEADDHVTYWNDKTEAERLNAACFIINRIFGVTPYDKVDFSYTDKRKHS
jgi:hypothetical protein